ncbi:hypothetical protein MKW92_047837 [Papaver armeniacum]|nr:hypothetical protein MKW92_047837 [Papaver armeniacum]
MAKPAVSLLFLGFCLVLVMSMSSLGVNADTCDVYPVPTYDINICKTVCEKTRPVDLVSFNIVRRYGVHVCLCCHK